jgi:hypothetical protein
MARLLVAGEIAGASRRFDEAGVEFFRSVGATRYLKRAETQLAAMA